MHRWKYLNECKGRRTGNSSKAPGWFNRSVATPATIFALLVLVVFAGCDTKQKTGNSETETKIHQRVAVTNYSLYCMVSSICRDANGPVNEVIYVGPPSGTDAHAWMPPADQVRDLQKVDLIVCNGPGAVFANWMDKVTIDESKLCKTTDAIKLADFVVVTDHQLVHSHGPEGEHSHSWVVPQSWLSPRIARKQARLCYERLIEVYGESTQLDNGFAELQKKFDELEAVVEEIRNNHQGLVVASSTPDVQYLTRELGWTDRYLQWTESREIEQGKKELAEMRARVAKNDPEAPPTEKLFLWSSTRIDSLGAFADSQWPSSTTIDLVDAPEESISADGYFERMATNLKRIGESLE